MNSETRNCQNCKQDFVIEPEDFAFYEKVKVPAPTFCPQCRFQRRLIIRNERKIFRGKSDKSGKDILSLYEPGAPVTVYEEKEWWADDWDPMEYGREYDFNRPFFEQFAELSKVVPRFHRSVIHMVNSDYCANAGNLKNCYLLFNANVNEDCAYGNAVDNSKDCFDNSHINQSERCYHSFWLQGGYQVFFSAQCEDCSNVWFSKNCRGCSDCFGCVNLRDKKYHIFNQPYSKEDYHKKLEEMKLSSWSGLAKAGEEAKKFWAKFPNKFAQGVKNTNSSGEYVTNSKNVKNGYLVREGEDMRYVQYYQVSPNKDCYDCCIWGESNELGYENCVTGIGAFNLKFCFESWENVKDMEYSGYCQSASNLFGCFGLRKKEYCILNKQYSKEEYFELREKIINHMNEMPYVDKKGRVYKYGEFYPMELSHHSYNHTVAQEHFPLTKEEALAEGYKWQDVDPGEYKTTKTAGDLPDDIKDVDESILKEIIECAKCKRAYRIIKPELEFLKSVHIPLPRLCIDCRHAERIAQRNKSKLYERKCGCGGEKSQDGSYDNLGKHFHGGDACPNEFETSYSLERPEIVYCGECYQEEVS